MADIRPLSQELAKKAADELNEEPERIVTDLEAIKQWLDKCPHLKARTNDQFLIAFLRGCKYSLERVKEKLDMFYTVRSALPEFIRNRDPLDVKTATLMKQGFAIPLEGTDQPAGSPILIIRPGSFDPSTYSITDAMKIAIMMNEVLMLENDNLVVAGQMIILDLAHVTLSHMLQMTPTIIKKLTMLWQEASPLRQKAFHFINLPAAGPQSFFNLLTSFMNEKLKRRIFLHLNYKETMFEQIPQSVLPFEYGGSAGTVDELMVGWQTRLIGYRKYFEDENNFGVDEQKRQSRAKNAGSLFGTEGSFRKLNLD